MWPETPGSPGERHSFWAKAKQKKKSKILLLKIYLGRNEGVREGDSKTVLILSVPAIAGKKGYFMVKRNVGILQLYQ